MTDIIKRLQKVSDHAGVLLTDPIRPTAIKAVCDEAIQIITDLRGRTTWQPIETAPRDGTPILCRDNYEIAYVVEWFRDGWIGADNRYWAPTHWQPLPAPPVTSESDA